MTVSIASLKGEGREMARKYLAILAISERDRTIYAACSGLNGPPQRKTDVSRRLNISITTLNTVCMNVHQKLGKAVRISTCAAEIQKRFWEHQALLKNGGYTHQPYRYKVKDLDPEVVERGYGIYLKRR